MTVIWRDLISTSTNGHCALWASNVPFVVWSKCNLCQPFALWLLLARNHLNWQGFIGLPNVMNLVMYPLKQISGENTGVTEMSPMILSEKCLPSLHRLHWHCRPSSVCCLICSCQDDSLYLPLIVCSNYGFVVYRPFNLDTDYFCIISVACCIVACILDLGSTLWAIYRCYRIESPR